MFSFSSSVSYLLIFLTSYFLNFGFRNLLNIIIFEQIKNILINLYVYAVVPNGTLSSILTIFNLLRLAFWPTVCSMLVNILCVHLKTVSALLWLCGLL